jgi:hypothetical protein
VPDASTAAGMTDVRESPTVRGGSSGAPRTSTRPSTLRTLSAGFRRTPPLELPRQCDDGFDPARIQERHAAQLQDELPLAINGSTGEAPEVIGRRLHEGTLTNDAPLVSGNAGNDGGAALTARGDR